MRKETKGDATLRLFKSRLISYDNYLKSRVENLDIKTDSLHEAYRKGETKGRAWASAEILRMFKATQKGTPLDELIGRQNNNEHA